MVKFFSSEFFSQFQDALVSDPKWQDASKGLKTTIRLTSTGATSATYVLKVEDGKTTLSPSDPGSPTEFSLEGTYDAWTKIAKGEVDIQAAVLKGLLKFKGSITKILLYKDRFTRIAELMRSFQLEY